MTEGLNFQRSDRPHGLHARSWSDRPHEFDMVSESRANKIFKKIHRQKRFSSQLYTRAKINRVNKLTQIPGHDRDTHSHIKSRLSRVKLSNIIKKRGKNTFNTPKLYPRVQRRFELK